MRIPLTLILTPTLTLLAIVGVCADGHSLRFYETGFSSPGSGQPEYSVIVFVDDQQILKYNSDTRQIFRKADWMEKFEDEYWDRETTRIRNNEPFFMRHVPILMKRFNHTKGLHAVQWMYGCELRDDGSTAEFYQFAYDGRDYLYLDTQSWIFVPVQDEAQILTQTCNSPEVKLGEINKIYLEIIFMEYLKKLIEYGKEELEKRVRPKVKVWGRQSDGVTRLHCVVYGFYPRSVVVKWVKNGTDHIISDVASPILPHPDGTYQIIVSVEVPTSGGDTYSCHVDHRSLEEILTVNWEPDNGWMVGGVVGAVIGSLVVVLLIITGVSLYRRRNNEYRSTSTSDNPPTSLQLSRVD